MRPNLRFCQAILTKSSPSLEGLSFYSPLSALLTSGRPATLVKSDSTPAKTDALPTMTQLTSPSTADVPIVASLRRSDAMEVMKMFYELEEQVSIRENNIYIMRKNLKNYNPRKAQTGLGSIIFNSYIRNIFFYFSFVLIFSLTYLLRIYIPDINEVFLYVLFGVLAIADIAVYILIRKRVKKRKKKKFIDETKNEYNYWMSQINNDAKELNILKPAIQDEYKKFNIAPEYRSQHAMHSMYDILSHHSTMTVLDAMKK